MLKPNLNKILNNFNKTITQLEKLVDHVEKQKDVEDTLIDLAEIQITESEFRKQDLNKESKRAANVSKKLKDLIGE